MRMIVLRIVASFLFALGLLGSAHAADPATMKSLQPFQKFEKGEGEGVAREYVSRDKSQFVAWLRAGKGMRTTCETLVRQMVEAHPGLPFEGCEGAAAAIEHDADFAVVACEDQMFLTDNWLAVTKEQGSAWGAWHRKCLAKEQVLVYKGQPLISTMCGNVVIPIAPVTLARAVVTAPLANATVDCPKGVRLYTNAWEDGAVYSAAPDLHRRIHEQIAAAIARDTKQATDATQYATDALSRTFGDELIRVVNVRGQVGIDVDVDLLDPATLRVVESLGQFPLVGGIVAIPLSEAQRDTRIVRTTWPMWFSSPTISAGIRQLWFFPREWVKRGSTERWCSMQQHGVYVKANMP